VAFRLGNRLQEHRVLVLAYRMTLAGHGFFDAVHGYVIENGGVPAWWPAWCLAYDVGAAAGLAWLLRRGLVATNARA
jgi:hypothetical protein